MRVHIVLLRQVFDGGGPHLLHPVAIEQLECLIDRQASRVPDVLDNSVVDDFDGAVLGDVLMLLITAVLPYQSLAVEVLLELFQFL